MGRSRKAVAPVLATLLMIAVAVSMSVIIFMWSQGFLANTSSSTGSQQGAQNQAAQSSISIEAITATPSGGLSDGVVNHGNLTVFVRNVGAVQVTIASIILEGTSSNTGFNRTLSTALSISGTSVIATSTPATLRTCEAKATGVCTSHETLNGATGQNTTSCTASATVKCNRALIVPSSTTSLNVAKGGSMTFTFTLPALQVGSGNHARGYEIASGDTITVKVTTGVGTFAQTSITVP